MSTKLPNPASLIPSPKKFKGLLNVAYHSAVVVGIAAFTSRLQKMFIKHSHSPKLSLDLEHIVQIYVHITFAMFMDDLLVGMQLLPENVVN